MEDKQYRLKVVEGELNAYRQGWLQYDRDRVRALKRERDALTGKVRNHVHPTFAPLLKSIGGEA